MGGGVGDGEAARCYNYHSIVAVAVATISLTDTVPVSSRRRVFCARASTSPCGVVALCSWLADTFKLPRSVAMPYTGVRDVVAGVGVLGHRDLSANRGSGDPGDFVMEALVDAGWAAV